MRCILKSPFRKLVASAIVFTLMVTMSNSSFGEDQAVQPAIGYRNFDAAAYHRTYERYDREHDTWGESSSSEKPSFRLVRSKEQGVNGGAKYELFSRHARPYENKDPAIGGINNAYEMFRQGDAWMFGLSFRKKSSGSLVVFDPKQPCKRFMNPQKLAQLSEGKSWTIKAPVVAHTYEKFQELANTNKTRQEPQMDTPVSFRWTDTLDVDGHKCAKIVFSMSDIEKIEEKGIISEVKLKGVSYFSLECGLPVSDTLTIERIQRKNDNIVEHKRWRLVKQLVLVSPRPSQIKEPLPLLDRIPAEKR